MRKICFICLLMMIVLSGCGVSHEPIHKEDKELTESMMNFLNEEGITVEGNHWTIKVMSAVKVVRSDENYYVYQILLAPNKDERYALRGLTVTPASASKQFFDTGRWNTYTYTEAEGEHYKKYPGEMMDGKTALKSYRYDFDFSDSGKIRREEKGVSEKTMDDWMTTLVFNIKWNLWNQETIIVSFKDLLEVCDSEYSEIYRNRPDVRSIFHHTGRDEFGMYYYEGALYPYTRFRTDWVEADELRKQAAQYAEEKGYDTQYPKESLGLSDVFWTFRWEKQDKSIAEYSVDPVRILLSDQKVLGVLMWNQTGTLMELNYAEFVEHLTEAVEKEEPYRLMYDSGNQLWLLCKNGDIVSADGKAMEIASKDDEERFRSIIAEWQYHADEKYPCRISIHLYTGK